MNEPEERSFFGSLNTIKTLLMSTCADKWEVAIETALPAAGKALYILIIPSPSEILENYLQPRGSRGRGKGGPHPHGRRQATRFGRLRWWQKIGFPDIDAIIAQHLPGRDLFEGRTAGRAEQWMWKGIDILDRGLWYWMLLDMAEDFTVNWASGIMESRFCTSPLNALFTAQGHTQPTSTSNPFWIDADEVTIETNFGWTLQRNGRLIRQNPLIGVSGQMSASISAHLKDHTAPKETEVRLQLSFFNGPTPIATFVSPTKTVKQGQTVELGLSATCEHFNTCAVTLSQPPGKPAFPIDSRDWVLSFFGDPD